MFINDAYLLWTKPKSLTGTSSTFYSVHAAASYGVESNHSKKLHKLFCPPANSSFKVDVSDEVWKLEIRFHTFCDIVRKFCELSVGH